MSPHRPASAARNEPALYAIRVRGHLEAHWAEWFGGLSLAWTEDGDTVLAGPVADQAALHGLLKRVRDLGMHLVSVGPAAHERAQAPPDQQTTSDPI